MKEKVDAFLVSQYERALDVVGSRTYIQSDLAAEVQNSLNEVLKRSESSKGVITVILTSVVYKHFYPSQDIRKHQSGITGGYSGRTFDAHHITPFLKKVGFPAMAESGWLTRSLEQKTPYDEYYTGAITPQSLKTAFLASIKHIEDGVDCEELLSYLLQGLILQRNRHAIQLAKPLSLSIMAIIDLLNLHFNAKYASEGAARLPVLALHAMYQCLVSDKIERYSGKVLLSMESHTTSDRRSGRIGDIEVSDGNGKPYEAVEVKHGLPLTASLVEDAFEKFSKTQVSRYYILSTNEIVAASDKVALLKAIERIRNIHGCQVIVNGLVSTLKYYLRLIADPADFIDAYVDLVEADKALKFEHRQKWNDLVSGIS